MKKIVMDFMRLSVVARIAFYRNVLKNMTGNEYFPNPDVTLADATAALDKLAASEQAARDGSHTAIATRNADLEVVDNMFRLIVAYVERMAAGDEVIIISSGFHLAKQPTSNNKPALQVLDGSRSGSVKLMAKAIEKAGSYIWQYAKQELPTTDAGWTTVYSTQASTEIDGLSFATLYYFRVAGVTPSGTTDFTPGVIKVIN